jgi:hypothetical protein
VSSPTYTYYIQDATYPRRHLLHPKPPRLRPPPGPIRPISLSSTHHGALASLSHTPSPPILWLLPLRFAPPIAPRVTSLGLGADPALCSRTDTDKDAGNNLHARVPRLCHRCAEAFCLACACSGRRAPAPLVVWRKTKSKSLSHRDRCPSPREASLTHLARAHPPRSLAPLPSSPLRAALISEPYGDDTDASRSATSYLACGLPFIPRCVWTGTEYGPAPTTYDDAHSQSERYGHGGRAVACASMSTGMERVLPELEL